MSVLIDKAIKDTYEKEIIDTLQRLSEYMPPYHEFDYFMKCVKKRYLTDPQKAKPKIVVIGSSLPEEWMYAVGETPYWVLGGSRATSMLADDVLPRDTDPVSRSSMGFVSTGIAENALILIPLVNDSARKLAYILKSMGLKVQPVYLPPVKDKDAEEEWWRQLEDYVSAVSRHVKKKVTKRDFQKGWDRVYEAKKQIKKFLDASDGVLSGVIRMFILSSYYCADDIDQWSFRLNQLTARFSRKALCASTNKVKVLLLGSPIYFPNYKVPFLIEESGLEITAQADYTSLKMQSGAKDGVRQSFSSFYKNEASPAYVKNDSLYNGVRKLISDKEIDGVVYHILKSQIEYDFELTRFEELFEHMKIPVFRLETDYNYQDVEQLRIRMEAFSEVLTQRRYAKEKNAV